MELLVRVVQSVSLRVQPMRTLKTVVLYQSQVAQVLVRPVARVAM
jgi:hypothetical protein